MNCSRRKPPSLKYFSSISFFNNCFSIETSLPDSLLKSSGGTAPPAKSITESRELKSIVLSLDACCKIPIKSSFFFPLYVYAKYLAVSTAWLAVSSYTLIKVGTLSISGYTVRP